MMGGKELETMAFRQFFALLLGKVTKEWSRS
jgi:hypothetical protein